MEDQKLCGVLTWTFIGYMARHETVFKKLPVLIVADVYQIQIGKQDVIYHLIIRTPLSNTINLNAILGVKICGCRFKSFHHFGPEWNTSAKSRWIVMKFGSDIRGLYFDHQVSCQALWFMT